ncbi:MAG: amidase [Burkholderiaceae bacterium]|nr:amidase [Burkholderiaceae bacterium]
MNHENLHYMGLREIGEAIQSGKISSETVTKKQFERISELDSHLKSYVVLMQEQALNEARRADQEIAQGKSHGPLHGVPVAVKDLCWTSDAPTAFGTTLHRGFQSSEDGTVVKRLREAGAVILGKVQLTEGALTDHHPDIDPPVNPWNSDHWAGVSSSGSGVAPAAGMCYGAIGTDTGGSIRYPSAACGLTGIKPTWGRVSRYGAFELAASLDHLGPMTRSAEDSAAMLHAIAGPDENDPTASHMPVQDYLQEINRGAKGLRIGIDRAWNNDDVDAPTRQMMDAAIEIMTKLGAEIIEVKAPDATDVQRNWFNLCSVEAAVAHEETYPSRKEVYGPALSGLIDTGRALRATDYQKILLQRAAYTGKLRAMMQGLDLLLVPTTPIASPTIAQMSVTGQEYVDRWFAMMRYTAPFDMAGVPTITLPGGFTQARTPLGFQFVGADFREDLLVRAAHAFQGETNWHKQRPTLVGS